MDERARAEAWLSYQSMRRNYTLEVREGRRGPGRPGGEPGGRWGAKCGGRERPWRRGGLSLAPPGRPGINIAIWSHSGGKVLKMEVPPSLWSFRCQQFGRGAARWPRPAPLRSRAGPAEMPSAGAITLISEPYWGLAWPRRGPGWGKR